MKAILKFNLPEDDQEFKNGVNAVFDKFYELLEDGKINLDKIMS